MLSICQSTRRDSSSGSDCSDRSDHSRSTAPTLYSVRPSLKHYHTDVSAYRGVGRREGVDDTGVDADEEVYACTVSSIDDLEDYEYPRYDEPQSMYGPETPIALPSSPPEFAEYFPSTKALSIRHGDTVDGNMNLCIDTEAQTTSGHKVDLTLFHLRMHDLKSRDFSLRRYCRDSGREVCHSSRKYAKPASERRPGIQRSMSNALASLRSKSDNRTNNQTSLKRSDSGYDSMSESEDECEFGTTSPRSTNNTGSNIPLPTNTTNLQFSNYAQVDIKRRGTKSSKRYEFDYWATSYAWKRSVIQRSAAVIETSYHLYNLKTSASVAHIVPVPLSVPEAREEREKGGWIPPCSMWISDEKIFGGSTDVADVIVATGLIALVDDCIKSRWHRKDRFQFPIPSSFLPSGKLNKDYLSPKRLIDEVFHRGANSALRNATSLRQTSMAA